MAIGYTTIGHATWLEWRTNTLGQAYDVDPQFGAGCQCWDFASQFYFNVGFPQGYPLTGPNHYASECWSVNRVANASYNGTTYFDLITNINDILPGDIIVMDGTTQNPPGHITFADESYDGSGYIWCVGQNQGGTPLPQGGTPVTRNRLGVSEFLGAFRYKDWHTTPPTPTGGETHKFKWVLYARNLRNKRNNML
jgi:hypothetical protein